MKLYLPNDIMNIIKDTLISAKGCYLKLSHKKAEK